MFPASRLDRPLAIACVLPAAILCFPATLAGELEPELSAAGWWALCALPAAVLVLLSNARPARPWVGVFSAAVMLAFVSREFAASTDTLQSARATISLLAALAAFAAGSLLGGAGRGLFVPLVAAISLATSLGALAGVAPRLQGALLNSGATSEVALGGALSAVALALDPRAWARRFALGAALAYGAFVGAAPVIAGAIAFLVPTALVWYRRRAERRWIGLFAASFVIAALGGYGVTRAAAPAASPVASAAAANDASTLASGNLGGIAVRLAIAPRALALLCDHPWLGVGPGQFRAAFPAYRSTQERSLSSAASQGRETEVEHAHDDYLTLLAELGLVGGGVWMLLYAVFAVRAWRALGSGDLSRLAPAAMVLGGLVGAALRAPLSFDPAAASLFYAAAGACFAASEAQDLSNPPVRSERSARTFALLLVALLAVQAPVALSLVRHGRALRLPDGLDLPAALAARPDSPLALALSARQLAADPARRAEALPLWERVLALRPDNFEARVQAGVLAAEAGLVAATRAHWKRALELAPERTFLVENLLLFEARRGEDADFESARRSSEGRVERGRIARLGARELLSGDERAGRRLLAAAGVLDPAFGPQALYDRAAERRPKDASEGPEQDEAAALELLAHLGWAREHAVQRDFDSAVRSLRQALRLAPGARAWRLELAAALWSAAEHDAARAEIERADPHAADWAALAPWAGEVLFEAGLFAVR